VHKPSFSIELADASAQAVVQLFQRHRAAVVSLVITLIFFIPSLKNGGADAGFLYGGDVLGWYLPALAKTHSLIHAWNFTAIDFSTFNGSSDFFLSPNFFAYHPLVVVYCLLVPLDVNSITGIGFFLVLLMAFHSFLACYFAIKLSERFFYFDFNEATLVAIVFAFSINAINSFGQPPFHFSASVVPWVIYAALSYADSPNWRRLLYSCLPVLGAFLGGYVPLGVAGLAMSATIVAGHIFGLDVAAKQQRLRTRKFAVALLPFGCATILVGPFLWATYSFHQETSSAAVPSVFYSAHQLAQLPQSMLAVFSQHFRVPGPQYEFTMAWGLIAIATAAIFFLSGKSAATFSERDWKIFSFASTFYFATVLATFGNFSVLSDLVYYYIPQVGKMHIYQRFLLPAQLFVAVMFCLMLRAVVSARPTLSIKICLAVLGGAMLTTAYIVAFKPPLAQELALNNYVVFELVLAFLFACVLIVPGKAFAFAAVAVFVLLPPLDAMYDRNLGGNTLKEQKKRQVMALDEAERAKLVTYLKKKFGSKELVKYVDITPMWGDTGVEVFPKVFPYFVLQEMHLSSYGGFTFYLSARGDYLRNMPVGQNVQVIPDWSLLEKTGADFVIAKEADLRGALASQLAKAGLNDVYKLPNGVVIVPLAANYEYASDEDPFFDNGYFRIYPERALQTAPPLENIALRKPAKQSSSGGGEAGRAVDGNTEGDFKLGSVTHTGREVNAWIEVDLESSQNIDNVVIWNRTDCCGYRLRDYWVFISDEPFLPSDTAEKLRARAATWSRVNQTPNPQRKIKTPNVRGRYVRVQFGGTQPAEESFLSVAELQVFRADPAQQKPAPALAGQAVDVKQFKSNFANRVEIEFESKEATAVQYLLWDNPRFKTYLNGDRATIVTKGAGARFIKVPAGVNKIELVYWHWQLTVFWLFYTAFGLALALALLPLRARTLLLSKIKTHWPFKKP
jgi:hypothetical protein